MMNNEQLQTNLEQAYYNGNGVDNALANGMLTAETASQYDWIEVQFPSGENRLCITCPCVVKNGPGPKYTAEDA